MTCMKWYQGFFLKAWKIGFILLGLLVFTIGCNGQNIPKILGFSLSSTTIFPGEKIAIQVSFASNGNEIESVEWSASSGKILGNGKSIITYLAPAEAGRYVIDVQLRYRSGVVEDSMIIEVLPIPTSTPFLTTTPTSTVVPTNTPSPTNTKTPTNTPSPTSIPIPPTPTNIPTPALQLVAPPDNSVFGRFDSVVFQWEWANTLEPSHFFNFGLWYEDNQEPIFHAQLRGTELLFDMNEQPPGRYFWRVVVVEAIENDMAWREVSNPSSLSNFQWFIGDGGSVLPELASTPPIGRD